MIDLTAPHIYFDYGQMHEIPTGASLYRVFDVDNRFIFGWAIYSDSEPPVVGATLYVPVEFAIGHISTKIIYVAERFSREKKDGLAYKMLYVRPEI